MRAMRADKFSGYDKLKLMGLPKPAVADGRVLVRMTAAGVTPLDHTILSGQYPLAKAPLVLGNEGAGVVEEAGGTDFPAGSRVMFTGPYGVLEDGAYSEWLAVRKESLCLIPQGVDDVTAASIPVAYLTAQMALTALVFTLEKPCWRRRSEDRSATRRHNWRVPSAQSTPSRARPTTRKPSGRRRSDSRSSIPPWRSWVTACVESQEVTAQIL